MIFKDGANGVIVKKMGSNHELLDVDRYDSLQEVLATEKLEIIYNRHDLLVAVKPGEGCTYSIYPCGGISNG